MDVKELQVYRTKLHEDLFNNKIPDRVPVYDGLGAEFVIQYSGKDLLTTQYDYSEEIVEEAFEKCLKDLMRGDMLGAGYARNAVALMLDHNVYMMMGSSGFIQHPEHCFMEPEEYDEYISNPYDFFLEKVSPRQSLRIAKGGAYRSIAVLLRKLSDMDQMAVFGKVQARMIEKYGLFREPAGSGAPAAPPFDLIADYARGFSKIPMDIRRCPEKLTEALNASMSFIIPMSTPANPNVLGSAKIMTHMAAFLSLKQFEKFYFPTYHDLHHILAEKGAAINSFLEQDWTRFVDLLYEMPMGTRFAMESGDMKKFKATLGKKHILGGFYPMEILRTGTKEQCIDKAKEILDIMAPGGNYYFRWNKSALSLEDVNIENYVSVMEYVRDNSHYEDAGNKVSDMRKEDTIKRGLANKYPVFSSKYIPSFEEFIKEYQFPNNDALPAMKKAYQKCVSRLAFARDL